jgi:hypothetical protein
LRHDSVAKATECLAALFFTIHAILAAKDVMLCIHLEGIQTGVIVNNKLGITTKAYLWPVLPLGREGIGKIGMIIPTVLQDIHVARMMTLDGGLLFIQHNSFIAVRFIIVGISNGSVVDNLLDLLPKKKRCKFHSKTSGHWTTLLINSLQCTFSVVFEVATTFFGFGALFPEVAPGVTTALFLAEGGLFLGKGGTFTGKGGTFSASSMA